MGASVGGRPCGTWGDAGLYSLDKGKNVSAIDGGRAGHAVRRVAGALATSARQRRPRPARRAEDALKVLAYAAMLPPRVY